MKVDHFSSGNVNDFRWRVHFSEAPFQWLLLAGAERGAAKWEKWVKKGTVFMLLCLPTSGYADLKRICDFR